MLSLGVDENEILDAVKRRHPSGTEIRVARTIPFFEGDLVVVEIMQGNEKVEENFYYASYFPSKRRSFTSMDEFVLWVAQQQSSITPLRSSSRLADFGVISGTIALIVTVTICILAVRAFAIPDILSNALSIILGFYFGSQVAKTRNTEPQQVTPVVSTTKGP